MFFQIIIVQLNIYDGQRQYKHDLIRKTVYYYYYAIIHEQYIILFDLSKFPHRIIRQ